MSEIDMLKFEKNYAGSAPSKTEKPDLVAIWVEARHHLAEKIRTATLKEAIEYQKNLLALQETATQ